MSIDYQVLGDAGRDNALLVRIDSGQSVERLLFDCGEGCPGSLALSEVRAIDHLLFTHLHMDHVGGFDTFFRATYDRTAKPNRVWGPPDTARILQHRFQGFLWNLHPQMSAAWWVHDVEPGQVRAARFELAEAFAAAHDEGTRPFGQTLCEGAGWCVDAVTMDHLTPTLAYVVRERPRLNVDTSRLGALGLEPGPWLRQLKLTDADADTGVVVVDGRPYPARDLREALLVETPGASVAYLSDFRLDDRARERLAPLLAGCRTLVCEAQYRESDAGLARRHYHLTATQAAELARDASADELVLFHLSDRYRPLERAELLAEARQVFSTARYPAHWAPGR